MAKEIWNNLKEKFQGSDKTRVNSVKQCLVELKDFRQKDGESIELYYDHLNELIYRCNRYGITRSAIEFNLIFVMGLRKEWRSVSMMVKNQHSFDTSTLNDLYNQLKTDESEVNEIAEESKAMLGGPLAFKSKISEKDADKDAPDEDEGFIMNFDDEAISFYSNNQMKKEEKIDSKPVEGKSEKKLKGDAGIDCHYCNSANHLANNCMLQKKDEKKTKGTDEEEDGTYQISSSGLDDEDMRNPTHGTMFAKMEEESEDDLYEVRGRCFVSKFADNSPMTTKVRNILESFNIPVHAYNSELVCFDETVTYFDSIVVSASNEAKKLSVQLLETQKKLDLKITRIDCLELQITNIMVDRDNLSSDNKLLLAQRNIYCNAAKRLYGKITELHHSCEISKEQHRKLLPFLAYERAKVDNISYDCEKEIADCDKVLNDNEISELEDVDCSQLSIVNVASNSKEKEKVKDFIVENETDTTSTSKVGELNYVDLKDYQTDDSDDEEVEKVSKEKASSKKDEIPRIVVDQVYGDTQKFEEVMNEKGPHYLETNRVVFPNFKCTDDVIFPNQVFVTKGNVENIKPELKKLVEEDNSKTTEEEKEKVVKLNSKEFNDQIDKFSKENNVSKRQVRKKILWHRIESQKMSDSKSTKIAFKAKNASFSKYQKSSQSNQTRSERNKQTKFSKVSETNKTREFSKRSNINQKVIQRQSFKSKVDTSYAYSYVTKPKVDYVPQKPNFPNYT
ncbi:uncharacterized protein LOC128134134 [Lactuca sativa]|uniref:uncharacterized protein LOC128134134 n=1 Tax=Lactuca sativa TaxID=4236 RepID=UPI0022AFCAED|nr:uncharacterized protein LOC128134134 [Lactuca sativa]